MAIDDLEKLEKESLGLGWPQNDLENLHSHPMIGYISNEQIDEISLNHTEDPIQIHEVIMVSSFPSG